MHFNRHGNTPKDITTAAGSAIGEADLKFYFPEWEKVDQLFKRKLLENWQISDTCCCFFVPHFVFHKVPLRTLPLSSGEAMTNKHGDGGWSTEKLQGWKDIMQGHARNHVSSSAAPRCDIDTVDVSKEDPSGIFNK